jgi:hypothetical protein
MAKRQNAEIQSLDDLQQLAAEVDNLPPAADAHGDPAAPSGDPAPESPGVSDAEKWARYPMIFGMIVARAMPELAEHYSEAACNAWGAAMEPIARRHGWNPDGVLGEWGALAVATYGFVGPTLAAVQARRAAAANPVTATEPQPGG